VRRSILPLLLVLLAASRAAAQPPESETQRLLVSAGSPSGLRAMLLGKADSLASSDPLTAGEYDYYAGRSFDRGSQPDSAILCYRRALERRGGIEERIALADVLLSRRGDGDVDEARHVLEPSAQGATPMSSETVIALDARRAWALERAGHPDSALAVYRPHGSQLTLRPEWRYRIAVAALAAGDPRQAFRLLLPLGVASRRQDRDVMARLQETVEQLNASSRLDAELDRAIQQRDAIEARALARIGAKRGAFPGDDGFLLSGAVIEPDTRARRLGAVVLVAPGDTIADYDSLGIALAHAGYAVMFLDLRGSGASVGPSCPLPDRWMGREEALETQCARDTRSAFNALARATSIDASRYLVVGVGSTAPIAVEAASIDRRIAALLLVSPRPDGVDRGTMRARLASLRVPVYFQSGPEDFDWFVVTERLYQAGNERTSRVAEARLVGHGVRQFYYDPAVTARFTRWLDETLRTPVRRAPPPAPRRRG
jgi:hypothetical protein